MGADVVFPAHAGMILEDGLSLVKGTSVPRACGDDPVFPIAFARSAWCSPRMRG